MRHLIHKLIIHRTLIIVKCANIYYFTRLFVTNSYRNYTGDVLNFGLAKEEFAASHPEKAHRVKFLVVGDDVSVGKTQGGLVGRR